MAVELKYRTFDELLSAVLSDFKVLDMEGHVDPQDLIKIAQRCNKELTLKIYREKQDMLEVCKGRVRMPNDFYALNYAFMCIDGLINVPAIQGIQTEDRIILDNTCNTPSPIPGSHINTTCNPCNINYELEKRLHPDVVYPGRPNNRDTVRFGPCGDKYEVVQRIGVIEHRYRHFAPVYLEKHKSIRDGFSNLGGAHNINNRMPFFGDSPFYHEHQRRHYRGHLKNGWLYFDDCYEGKVFISYDVNMEDEDGNLLVLDHDIINEYYEYEMKTRILENMLVAGEQYLGIYKLIDEKRKKAKIEAITIMKAPDFQDIIDLKYANQKVQYEKYYRLFSSPHFFVPSTGGWI
jgi:hypothetical protein